MKSTPIGAQHFRGEPWLVGPHIYSTVLPWGVGIAIYHDRRHPLLMILSYFFLTVAMLNYRIHKASERTLQRIHYLLMILVAILGSIGVHYAVVKNKTNSEVKHYLHAVLGLAIIALFLVQFFLGGGSISLIRLNRNHGLIQLHRMLGPIIYVGVAATLVDGVLGRCRDISCGALVLLVGLTTFCTALGLVGSDPPHYDGEQETTLTV